MRSIFNLSVIRPLSCEDSEKLKGMTKRAFTDVKELKRMRVGERGGERKRETERKKRGEGRGRERRERERQR